MNTTLAERIKIIIKEQNLKQSEFADALGVSANYISLLVTGRKNNVSLTFAKLIDALFGYPAFRMQDLTCLQKCITLRNTRLP